MNNKFDNEKLTAYVLGEVDEDTRAEIAREAEADPELAREIEELREVTTLAKEVYLSEPDLQLDPAWREQVLDTAAANEPAKGRRARGERQDVGWWYRFGRPTLGALTGAAAAAALLIWFGYTRELDLRAKADKALRENAMMKSQLSCYETVSPSEPVDRVELEAATRRASQLTRPQETVYRRSPEGGSRLTTPWFVEGQSSGVVVVGRSPYNDPAQNYWPGHNTEAYSSLVENPFKRVADAPLSTFSIDVDTASYSNVRRFLEQGTLPPPDAVRIEELVNYFDYDYAPPEDRATPFAAHVTVANCPWALSHRLVRIGLKGWEMAKSERPASNLVFLIDVSGSMEPENKLPLVQRALRLLTHQLDERDRVAMVVYAGSTGLVLPSTPGNDREEILEAIDRLESGGSTNGGAGIELAYRIATEHFIKGGANRVILATDGDFNVGVTNEGDLTRLIEEKAKSGVFLTVLGFGLGNLKDATMEKLADKGNGNYAYIDTLNEARKVLVEQMTGTLVTIAKDVKIQVEFNPAQVEAYRLIGYENRILAAEDFNDDTKDAGEIGAGHTVTALYELVPAGQTAEIPSIDPLRYQHSTELSDTAAGGELMAVKLRYKAPDGDTSELLTFPVTDTDLGWHKTDPDFKFAAAVASFGMLLRNSEFKGTATFDNVLEWAEWGLGEDPSGYRTEFLELVGKAQKLAGK